MSLVPFDSSIVTVKQPFIFSQNFSNYVRAVVFRGNFIVVLLITRIGSHTEVCTRDKHSV